MLMSPAARAAGPLTVVVQQLNGTDPLIEKLAQKVIHSTKFPDSDSGFKDHIRLLLAAELTGKLRTVETIESPAMARVSGPLAAE